MSIKAQMAGKSPKEQIDMYMSLIADSYRRQATSRDVKYRNEQMIKVNRWLEEATQLLETKKDAWI